MDDIHLHPFSFSVDNADLLEAFLLTFEEIVLQERRNLLRGESMKVDPILDGNLNSHYLENTIAHRAGRIAKKIYNSKLITQNSQLSTSKFFLTILKIL